jgi:hypothetical protein
MINQVEYRPLPQFRPALLILTTALVFKAVIPVSSKTVSSKEFPSIQLQCNAEQQPSLCAALAKALTARTPGREVSTSAVPKTSEAALAQDPQTGLTVRYQEKTRTASWLSGQLFWQVKTGAPVEGPVVEFSVMDRDLQPDDMVPFADALIRASDLPL